MAALPSQSSGVLAAALGDLTVLYDLVAEVVHVLNPTAGLVWDACDAVSDLEQVVKEITEVTAADAALVTTDIEACVAQLTQAGLLDRLGDAPTTVPPPRTAVHGASSSAVHAVLDDGVRFLSDDPGLLAAVDALLGSVEDQPEATVDLGVHEDEDGAVRLVGWGAERTFASRQPFLWALPSALNEIAAASSTCIALHGGAVRSRDGGVLLLPAVSGAGKTTLTAALVQAGWDYVTDEAVGVRADSLTAVAYPKPLVLDASSRAVLGLVPTASPNTGVRELCRDVTIVSGEAGPVVRVVLPRFEAGADTKLEDLDPQEAVVGILEHALNLRRVGRPGLDALCQLAEQVPVHRLVHGDVASAVAAIEGLGD